MTSSPRSPHVGVGLALAAGLAWIVAVAIVGTQADTDPVGAGYDAANRALTPALVLMLAFALWLRSHPAPSRAKAGATALVVAAALLLTGNLLEFWGVLLSDLHTAKTAIRLGEDDSYWGSDVGWFVFLPGLLATVVSSVLLARANSRARGLLGIVLAVAGTASTALWAISALAAAAAGTGMALWWLLLATDADRESGQVGPGDVVAADR